MLVGGAAIRLWDYCRYIMAWLALAAWSFEFRSRYGRNLPPRTVLRSLN